MSIVETNTTIPAQPQTLTDVVTAALIAADADTDVLAEAHQAIAAGTTYSAFAQAVRDERNADLLPVVDILDDLIRRVADKQSLKPLLALIEQERAAETSPAGPRRFAFAEQVVSTCLQRRPGRDPETGRLLPGAIETDWADRLPCVRPIGHDGEHRDFSNRVWSQADDACPLCGFWRCRCGESAVTR
jgi:hypothetical protein